MVKSVRAEDYYESAMMHLGLGDKPAAILQLQEAILLRPNYGEAWNNRANLLLQLGHPFDALLNFDQAIRSAPNVPEYYNNKGAALAGLSRYQEAVDQYDMALKLKPKFSHALINKGNSLKVMGYEDAAIENYRQAVVVDPDHAEARLNLSIALLAKGELKEGWANYDARWKSYQLPVRGLPFPEWNGEPLTGKKLLIYAEQGNGDCLQFVRYATTVKERFGGRVFIEVRPAMTRLCRSVALVDGVITYGEQVPPDIDYCVPMMTLPRILGINTVDDIKWPGVYFKTDAHRRELWQAKIKEVRTHQHMTQSIAVGLCWAGLNRPHQPGAADIDSRRSMALQQFAPLALVNGITWMSLQKGPPATQLQEPIRGLTIGDYTDEMDDFYDTAALVDCLDLVITVDTAVAHLAGALGKPVWMLSRFDNCWRWFGKREDSPWYPSLRQFIQPEPNDWKSLIMYMSTELKRFVQEHSAKAA